MTSVTVLNLSVEVFLQALLPRLHCFQEGTCIVHHLFGAEVSEMVKAAYGDAFLTAHFEVCTVPPSRRINYLCASQACVFFTMSVGGPADMFLHAMSCACEGPSATASFKQCSLDGLN